MPCRCDGYEPSAADVRVEMSKQVEHLDGQLCNARSLIHKILKATVGIYDGGGEVDTPIRELIPPELLERADKHIALLLKHKREEHQAEVDTLDRQRAEAERRLRSAFDRASEASAEKTGANERLKRIEEQLKAKVALTDEDILG